MRCAREEAEGLGFGRDGDELRALVDFLAMQAALRAGNGDAYAEHLGHVAARGNAAEFAGLQRPAVFVGLRTAAIGNQDRAVLALARSPAFPSLTPEMRGSVAAEALRPALAAGDTAVAEMLVGQLRDAEPTLGMLVDRDYESGWPMLARRVGPHAQTMLLQGVETATADLSKAPEDRLVLSRLVDALVDAGRFDEAIAAAQRIDHTDKGLRKAGEYDGWIINAEVRRSTRWAARPKRTPCSTGSPPCPGASAAGWSISSSTTPDGWCATGVGPGGAGVRARNRSRQRAGFPLCPAFRVGVAPLRDAPRPARPGPAPAARGGLCPLAGCGDSVGAGGPMPWGRYGRAAVSEGASPIRRCGPTC
jgi:hypothetical protein